MSESSPLFDSWSRTQPDPLIDGLAAHQGDVAQGAISDEVIDTLKASQVKLAAEQARYEISFREDLAALAEQVRQLRGR